jgi:hypothetical protein
VVGVGGAEVGGWGEGARLQKEAAGAAAPWNGGVVAAAARSGRGRGRARARGARGGANAVCRGGSSDRVGTEWGAAVAGQRGGRGWRGSMERGGRIRGDVGRRDAGISNEGCCGVSGDVPAAGGIKEGEPSAAAASSGGSGLRTAGEVERELVFIEKGVLMAERGRSPAHGLPRFQPPSHLQQPQGGRGEREGRSERACFTPGGAEDLLVDRCQSAGGEGVGTGGRGACSLEGRHEGNGGAQVGLPGLRGGSSRVDAGVGGHEVAGCVRSAAWALEGAGERESPRSPPGRAPPKPQRQPPPVPGHGGEGLAGEGGAGRRWGGEQVAGWGEVGGSARPVSWICIFLLVRRADSRAWRSVPHLLYTLPD